jgi:hypothetical protein
VNVEGEMVWNDENNTPAGLGRHSAGPLTKRRWRSGIHGAPIDSVGFIGGPSRLVPWLSEGRKTNGSGECIHLEKDR